MRRPLAFLLGVSMPFLLGCSERDEVMRFCSALSEITTAAADILKSELKPKPTAPRLDKLRALYPTLDRAQVAECMSLSQELSQRPTFTQQLVIGFELAENVTPANGWLRGSKPNMYVAGFEVLYEK